MRRTRRGIRRSRGASTVEYALALALVVVVMPPAIRWMNDASKDEFQNRAASAGAPDLDSSTTTSTTTIPTTTVQPPPPPPVAVNATATLSATANRQGNTWSATVTVTIIDQNGQPVQGALVTGTWDPGLSGQTSCSTGANGQCSMTQAGMEARDNKPYVASVEFSASTVTKTSDPNFSYGQTPPPSIGPIDRPT